MRTHATPQADELAPLIGDIYDAALEPELWNDLLPRVGARIGSTRCSLGLAIAGSEVVTLGFKSGLDPALFSRWQNDYASFDPWTETVGRTSAVGVTFHGAASDCFDRVRSTAVYSDCYRPLGIHDVITTSTALNNAGLSFFSTYRAPDEPAFAAENVERAREIAPHLVRAASVHEKVWALRSVAAGGGSALDLVPFGVIVLSHDSRVLFANASAEMILRRQDGAAIRAGRLVGARDCGVLQRAIAAARARGSSSDPGVAQLASLRRAHPLRPYQVLVAPVREAHLLPQMLSRDGAGAGVIVLISDPEASVEASSEAIARLFALPPALARLAAGLAAGQTVREYSNEHAVTEGTARQQLKELLARTGTNRQVELVRVVLTSLATLRAPEGES